MKEWLIVHRGAQKNAKENTLKAFEDSLKYPVGWIELDVHTTNDGVVICHHDFKINGLEISRYAYKKLKISYPQLTTFKEAVEIINNKKPLIVEIKPVGTAKNILSLLNEYKDWQITSFKIDVIKELINLGIDKKRLFLLQHWYNFNFGHVRKANKLGLAGVGVKKWVMTPRIYRQAIYKDLQIYTYVVNSPFHAKLLKLLFTRLLICTDRPDLLQKIR